MLDTTHLYTHACGEATQTEMHSIMAVCDEVHAECFSNGEHTILTDRLANLPAWFLLVQTKHILTHLDILALLQHAMSSGRNSIMQQLCKAYL